jgi:hypothetical protein
VSRHRCPSVPAALVLLALATALGTPALAADDAEVVRLREEMQKRVQNSQWSGAERAFSRLEAEVADEPGALSPDDWQLGASIARNLGDMAGVQRRLQVAFDLEPTDALRSELQQIAATYGPIRVEVASGYAGELSLTATPAPFESDKRKFIDAAAARLEEERTFDGLIPIGRYTIAGEPVEVTTGAIDTLRVTVAGDGTITRDRIQGGGGSEAPGLEAHATLGVGFGALTAASRGLQPEPFSGLGLRIGGGVDAWIGPTLGIRVELGYQNVLGGGAEDLSGGASLPADQIHQGYVWLGGTWRAGPLDVAVGPQVGLGVARANGIDGEAWAARCADTPEDAACRGLSVATADDLATTSLGGRMLTVGGTLGATWEFLPDAPARPALGLTGGALADGRRLLPWGQLALSVRL